MKRRWLTAFLVGVTTLATAPQSSRFCAQERRHNDSEFQQRDEIRRSLHLTPGARVEVSGIRGPVEIQTSETGATEVHIIRSARTKDELKQHKVLVEQTPTSLTLRGEQGEREQQASVRTQVRHRVLLKIPSRVDLTVNSISGSVKIGDVNGKLSVNNISGWASIGKASEPVRISSISGDVKLEQASDSLDLSNVSGSSFVTIARIEEEGIRINNVSGKVELRFTTRLNAELTATHISGRLYIDVPHVLTGGKLTSPTVRARIGSGGAVIIINGVSGSVRLASGT